MVQQGQKTWSLPPSRKLRNLNRKPSKAGSFDPPDIVDSNFQLEFFDANVQVHLSRSFCSTRERDAPWGAGDWVLHFVCTVPQFGRQVWNHDVLSYRFFLNQKSREETQSKPKSVFQRWIFQRWMPQWLSNCATNVTPKKDVQLDPFKRRCFPCSLMFPLLISLTLRHIKTLLTFQALSNVRLVEPPTNGIIHSSYCPVELPLIWPCLHRKQ